MNTRDGATVYCRKGVGRSRENCSGYGAVILLPDWLCSCQGQFVAAIGDMCPAGQLQLWVQITNMSSARKVASC